MYKIITLFVILLVLGACNFSASQKETTTGEEQTQEGFYGEKIKIENPVTGKELVSLLTENDSVWVTMKSLLILMSFQNYFDQSER